MWTRDTICIEIVTLKIYSEEHSPSNNNLSGVLLAGSLTWTSRGPASIGKDAAFEYPDPGINIYWCTAPASRMALTAVWTVSAQSAMETKSWGSFMIPNWFGRVSFDSKQWEGCHTMIRSLLTYLAATWYHMLTNWSLVGPPWPMIPPYHRA